MANVSDGAFAVYVRQRLGEVPGVLAVTLRRGRGARNGHGTRNGGGVRNGRGGAIRAPRVMMGSYGTGPCDIGVRSLAVAHGLGQDPPKRVLSELR